MAEISMSKILWPLLSFAAFVLSSCVHIDRPCPTELQPNFSDWADDAIGAKRKYVNDQGDMVTFKLEQPHFRDYYRVGFRQNRKSQIICRGSALYLYTADSPPIYFLMLLVHDERLNLPLEQEEFIMDIAAKKQIGNSALTDFNFNVERGGRAKFLLNAGAEEYPSIQGFTVYLNNPKQNSAEDGSPKHSSVAIHAPHTTAYEDSMTLGGNTYSEVIKVTTITDSAIPAPQKPFPFKTMYFAKPSGLVGFVLADGQQYAYTQ